MLFRHLFGSFFVFNLAESFLNILLLEIYQREGGDVTFLINRRDNPLIDILPLRVVKRNIVLCCN